MDLFNKTFFRFAFGFLGIVMLSVTIIFVMGAIRGGGPSRECPMGCGGK